jgi:hypothetical protein
MGSTTSVRRGTAVAGAPLHLGVRIHLRCDTGFGVRQLAAIAYRKLNVVSASATSNGGASKLPHSKGRARTLGSSYPTFDETLSSWTSSR